MIEVYKIVLIVIFVSLVFYAYINDPLKKNKLN